MRLCYIKNLTDALDTGVSESGCKGCFTQEPTSGSTKDDVQCEIFPDWFSSLRCLMASAEQLKWHLGCKDVL